jgi:hypothetical protein
MKLPDLFNKLYGVYEQHQNLIIALDFDDTIFDWKNSGYDLEYIRDLVRRCQKHLNAKVILFTCREGLVLSEAIDYCNDQGIGLWGVNKNPDHPPTSSKPFYNVLLDDKACLAEVAAVLERLLKEFGNEA